MHIGLYLGVYDFDQSDGSAGLALDCHSLFGGEPLKKGKAEGRC